MNTKTSAIIASALLAFSAGSVIGQTQAIVSKVEVKDVEVTMLKTPAFTADTGKIKKTPRRQEWAEIEVKFEVEGKSVDGYVDSLLFKYFVVLDDDKKTMVTATVTHVNVPLDEELYSSVYLSPSTLAKILGGKDKARENSIEGFAVEILYQGQSFGGEAKPSGPTRWWQSRPATDGLLLSKDKTPYAPLWWDRFAEIQAQ